MKWHILKTKDEWVILQEILYCEKHEVTYLKEKGISPQRHKIFKEQLLV